MDNEFTPIIESGVDHSDYTTSSPFKLLQTLQFSSPRTPVSRLALSPVASHRKLPSTPTKLRSESFPSVDRKQWADVKNLASRGVISHSQLLKFSNGYAASNGSASSPRKLVQGGQDESSGAIRSRNEGNHDFALISKPAPIRSLSFSMSRLSFKRVSVDVRRLRKLARQGSWKLLVEKVKDAQKRGLLAIPDQEITYGTYHLLALMKLQDYHAAAEELAAFGDLDSPQYRYENHLALYPDKSGSMVPFALRCMHAELPHRLGKTSTTVDRLYNLLAHCDSQIDALQAERSSGTAPLNCSEAAISTSATGPHSDSFVQREGSIAQEILILDAESSNGKQLNADGDIGDFLAHPDSLLGQLISTWQKRREAVSFALVGYHLAQKQFIIALQGLNELMAKSPSDPYLISKVALIQLQLGDVLGAQKTFSDVEALVFPTSDLRLENLVNRNRGLLHVSIGEYSKAIQEFDAVLARDPADIVSANNKALCLLYTKQLIDATDILETSIYKGPRSLLNEAVALNVCSMYELVSSNSAAAKRGLRTWVREHGPDDFQASSFRL